MLSHNKILKLSLVVFIFAIGAVVTVQMRHYYHRRAHSPSVYFGVNAGPIGFSTRPDYDYFWGPNWGYHSGFNIVVPSSVSPSDSFDSQNERRQRSINNKIRFLDDKLSRLESEQSKLIDRISSLSKKDDKLHFQEKKQQLERKLSSVKDQISRFRDERESFKKEFEKLN